MEAMVLGVYHFDSLSNQFKVTDDVMTRSRQKEIDDVIDCLVRFRPTKIAVEQLQSEQSRLDDEYANFAHDNWPLPANECYQLGFRVAKQLGHGRVYAIDMRNEQSDLTIGDVFEFAERYNPELHQQMNKTLEKLVGEMQTRIETQQLRRVLCWLNDPSVLQTVHKPYLTMAQVGDGEHRLGLQWVVRWYERNLTIYSNLMGHATSDDDRWLVIYGQGHVPLLTQFLTDSGKVNLVQVANYLF